MPVTDTLARFIPPGTSRRKLVVAGSLVAAALAVVVVDVVVLGDEPDAAMAMDLDGDGYVDGDAPAASPPRAAIVVPPAPDAAAPAAEAEPDWQGLLDQFLARADVGTGPGGAASPGLRVAGIVTGGAEAVALVDGRFLRVGDEVPGTRYTVGAILADRVDLEAPGRPAPLTLRLAPLGAGAN